MRRIAIILGALLAFFALGLALLPWWFGGALAGFARSRGATFDRYERVGYARFALHGVVVEQPTVKVTVSRVEAPTPLLWLTRKITGGPREVRADTWRVEVKPPPTPRRPAPADVGWMRLRGQLFRITAAVGRLVSDLHAGPGEVRWGVSRIHAASARFHADTVQVKALGWGERTADAELHFDRGADRLRLTGDVAAGSLRLDAVSTGPALQAQLHVWEQPANLEARFAPRGWMPATARVLAEQWTLTGAQLRMAELYRTVLAHGAITWQDGRFDATVTSNGVPVEGQRVPPLVVDLRAHGDLRTAVVERLDVKVPGLNAGLNEPIRLEAGRLASGRSRFTFDADLAGQPWLGATGRASGTIDVTPGAGDFPHTEISIEAGELAWRDQRLSKLRLAAMFEWPRLEVREADVAFIGDDRVRVRGRADLQARLVESLDVDGQLTRASIATWVPAALQFESTEFSAKASGPFDRLRHEGAAQVAALHHAPFKPAAVKATWKGAAGVIETLDAEALAGTTTVRLRGAVAPGEARIEELHVLQPGAERLRLAAPAVLQWRDQLTLTPLRLTGEDALLELAGGYGPMGNVTVAAKNIPSAWWSDFVETKLPAWTLNTLNATGSWDRGPLTFRADTVVTAEAGAGRPVRIEGRAAGDGQALQLESLRILGQGQEFVAIQGRLPVQVFPVGAPTVRVDESGPVELHARSKPDAAFWADLARLTGVELTAPQLTAHVAGTWQSPRGEVRLQTDRVALAPGRFNFEMPTFEALDVHLNADRGGLELRQFQLKVDGQALTATGRLPVDAGRWVESFRAPRGAIERAAELHLQIPDADVSALARHFPTLIAPKGRLQADLTLARGGDLAGFVRIQDAATRPLGPLGVLQDITADVRLAGRAVEVQTLTARSGGQPVNVTGRVELPRVGQPRFDLALKGENLPFVRQTGLLMRGDLDLKLATTDSGVPRLSGTTRLRDSLFLSDVRALIPTGGTARGPARRPPYFAVEGAPLNAWELAVEVTGDRFLRLRSTVFSGVVSARFKLAGTLGEPRATGEAVIDEGRVLLPFAVFAVQQGWVRLTEENPYEPQVWLAGTSRRYGYDLRMELNGTASNPALVFSSSPPLDSEQVLLMVMAGETPRDEVSYSTNQRFARLGTYLGQSLLNSFGGDSTEPDRLEISSGEKVSRQGRETYNIEYGLNDRWSLVGEYDEFDDYNAGVKWKFLSGKKEPAPDEKK